MEKLLSKSTQSKTNLPKNCGNKMELDIKALLINELWPSCTYQKNNYSFSGATVLKNELNKIVYFSIQVIFFLYIAFCHSYDWLHLIHPMLISKLLYSTSYTKCQDFQLKLNSQYKLNACLQSVKDIIIYCLTIILTKAATQNY